MSGKKSISRRDLLRGRIFKSSAPEADAAETPLTRPKPRPPAMILRPPGAIEEPAFLEGCTRCNDCATACPVDAIFPAPPGFGPATDTPMIDPMASACVMCEDMPCAEACEPNVLRRELGFNMGTAVIKAMHCLAYNGTLCTVCSERCPAEGAITLNSGRPVIHEEKCTGCGVCQHVCPAPYNAVAIRPNADRYESTDAPDASTDGGTGTGFDWRGEYLGGRSLRPEDNLPPSP